MEQEMRKPRDIDGELKALQERARALKAQRTVQLGELVEATGADVLDLETLAGVLLAAVEQAHGKPEAVARWTERGAAFFQAGGKKSARKGKAGAASEPHRSGSPDRQAGGSLI
ncbi:hypothetical protein Gdia_3572 (plasmid) [Gluconacetobacter diazotrophicus PA1 5]|nr:hypothetical protein Gdia_3572 [Gluconacetobacter diazotrophicus PA1 5]